MRITRTDESGAAAVEMALVLPFLILLLAGIVDFGLAFNARVTLSHAARESVRVWALGGTVDEAEDRAQLAAPTVAGVSITTTACTFGQPTTVRVSAPYQFIFPFVGRFADGTMRAEGVMRCGG